MTSTALYTATCVVVDPQPEDYCDLLRVTDAESWSFRFFLSAQPALRFAAVSSADLWLINLELSDFTGLDLLAMLRDRLDEASVCLVGNRDCAQLERQALRARPTAYVVKPIDGQWFRQWTGQAAHISGNRPNSLEGTAPAAPQSLAPPSRAGPTGLT